jgi:hypothetical protein
MNYPWRQAWCDYYKLLGIRSGFNTRELRRAYRKAAAREHPDSHAAAEKADATQRFLLVQEAYHVLSDTTLAAEYQEDYLKVWNLSGIFGRSLWCHIPNCGRTGMGVCAKCGRFACGFHLDASVEAKWQLRVSGLICLLCLPHCEACGCAVLTRSHEYLELVRRLPWHRGLLCEACLEEAHAFACDGCSAVGLAFRDLSKCPYCRKDYLCRACLEEHKRKSCPVRKKTEALRMRAKVLSGLLYASAAAIDIALPSVGFYSGMALLNRFVQLDLLGFLAAMAVALPAAGILFLLGVGLSCTVLEPVHRLISDIYIKACP